MAKLIPLFAFETKVLKIYCTIINVCLFISLITIRLYKCNERAKQAIATSQKTNSVLDKTDRVDPNIIHYYPLVFPWRCRLSLFGLSFKGICRLVNTLKCFFVDVFKFQLHEYKNKELTEPSRSLAPSSTEIFEIQISKIQIYLLLF